VATSEPSPPGGATGATKAAGPKTDGAKTARKRTAAPRGTAKQTTAGGARKPAGGAPRRPPAAAAARRTAPVPPPGDAGWRSGLGTLLRGSGGVLGQISGIDGPARSLERLARAAEKAGAMLDRIDAEVGIERLLAVVDQIERLTLAAEELRDLSRDMQRSIRELEERVVDLHTRISPPLDRLPLTRRRARKAAEEIGLDA
jgi:hypothetical protein